MRTPSRLGVLDKRSQLLDLQLHLLSEKAPSRSNVEFLHTTYEKALIKNQKPSRNNIYTFYLPGIMTSISQDTTTLEQVAQGFRNNVLVQDRKYRLKTYKQCFVGAEAVDYLIESGVATSRDDAVQVGRALQKNLFLFEHVTRDHDFADDGLYYRFMEENERGGLSENIETGKKINWSDFLAPVSMGGGNSTHDTFQPTLPLPDLQAVSNKDHHVASKVWPLDDYNTELLNHVHPPDWNDPKSDGNYDLVVIGGGTAGLITAAGSAGVGAKVAMIEEHMLGGE